MILYQLFISAYHTTPKFSSFREESFYLLSLACTKLSDSSDLTWDLIHEASDI